ncbi:UNVERIFIED_CONTAM: hypothetical protein K2H54_061398 [Gekko kuhli]
MGNAAYKSLDNGEAMFENASLADHQGIHPAGIALVGGKVEASLQNAGSVNQQGSMRQPEPSNGKQDSAAQPLERPIKTEAELTLDGNDVTDVSQIKIIQVEKKHNIWFPHLTCCPIQDLRENCGYPIARAPRRGGALEVAMKPKDQWSRPRIHLRENQSLQTHLKAYPHLTIA